MHSRDDIRSYTWMLECPPLGRAVADSILQLRGTVNEPSTLPRVGSAGLILDSGGRLLFGRRAKEPNFGKWVLPGGRIEPYETIASSLSREVKEETGLEVAVGQQAGVFEIVRESEEHRIIIYSWAHPVAGHLEPSSDLSEVRYATPDEAAALDVSEFVRHVLDSVGWPSNWRTVARRSRVAQPVVRRRVSRNNGRGLQIELGF